MYIDMHWYIYNMYIYIYNTSILGAVPVFDTVQVSTYTIVPIYIYECV